ncbi:cbb3-type cytochrome oxidase assembly protein CcoS [Congregibacter litoralis]|uniref:Cytochrome oxidase maturation protein, cbb3-type n=1 Tax=Congregibacter litoralis KT71 TaxID=314285 RepID=A4A3X0_9GAMM|nr:cbb3-type cytochrome oxidase assembly protein CcoS [Congregibacter litoralis]EAQ99393.1 cytochrome oxidase maturation protein, cbb3-type [Congregibacter litoralis KT71]
MESLYLLIPVAIVFAVIVIRLLLWAIDSGQYDDLDKESWRILADEDIGETGENDRQEDRQKDRQDSSRSTGTNDDQ